ncbi:ester cyclase [Micromonospora sp. NPDC050187]|uniref:ester cyclase n=1 Tax=Micromonospora sp. NPDC050187 TaxID=3364277 RepID=UPI00378F71F5
MRFLSIGCLAGGPIMPNASDMASRAARAQTLLMRSDDARFSTWDTHQVDAFVDLLADAFVLRDTTISAPITTRDGVRDYARAWLTAFPDMRIRRTSRLVDEADDTVAAEVEFTGTNTGPLTVGARQVPPTGKAVVGRGAYFARMKAGRFVELSFHPDQAGVLAQLGLMP